MLVSWGCLIFQVGYITIAKVFGLEIEEMYIFLTMIVAIISSFFYVKGKLTSQSDRITAIEEFNKTCQNNLSTKDLHMDNKFNHVGSKIDELSKTFEHKYDDLYKGQQEILQTIINVMNAKAI